MNSYIKKLKFYFVNIIYQCLLPVNLDGFKGANNNVLLIRLDAIGDYLLFRNFIEHLVNSEKYKGKHVTLVGNLMWKPLALELDDDLVDEFIWIDRKKFAGNLWYRYQKLKQISSSTYETVISPVFSREFFYADWIVKAVGAQFKIGSVGDFSNITLDQKRLSDNWFTELVPARGGLLFEFYRNKEFFEYILGEQLTITKPVISSKPKRINVDFPERYAVLFIGASSPNRKWPIGNYSKIGQILKKKYGFNIVLCGGRDDAANVDEFEKGFVGEYIDCVGKSSLVELLQIIGKANVLVSNETVAPHCAVSLNVDNIFVISNGNHFGRFVPYPRSMMESYHVIYPPEIQKNKDDYIRNCDKYGCGSDLDISQISVDSVVSRIAVNMG